MITPLWSLSRRSPFSTQSSLRTRWSVRSPYSHALFFTRKSSTRPTLSLSSDSTPRRFPRSRRSSRRRRLSSRRRLRCSRASRRRLASGLSEVRIISTLLWVFFGTKTNVCSPCNTPGSIPELDPATDAIYNTCTVYDPEGALVAVHRKIHLFDIDIPGKITFKESETLTPGKTLSSFDTRGYLSRPTD